MNKLAINFFFAAALGLSGCASETGWTPTVDTYNDPNAARLSQDMADCEKLAKRASGGTAKQAATGAAAGGLMGAASGAVIGAIGGSAGTGAATGAAVGGLGGAITQGLEAERSYKNAYNNCMSGRGHRVIR